MGTKTKVVQCAGHKNNGDRCTREKEVPIDFEGEWRCWQHPKGGQKKSKQGAGHKLPQDKVEQIKADLQVYTSINYIAKRNEVSWETVKRIEEEYEDDIEKYRDEKKKEFADRAWESIQDAMKIGDRKLKLTLEKSEELDYIMKKLVNTANQEDVSFRALKDQLKLVSALADYSLRDLSTFVGTLIDKHELVTGGATSRTENEHTHNVDPIAAILQADKEIEEGDKDGSG